MDEKEIEPFQTAKKLKEAGFDYPCSYYYTGENAPKGHIWRTQSGEPENFNVIVVESQIKCSAPMLWQAAKWLREVKGIAINVICHEDDRILGKYHWKDVILPNCNEKGHQWYEWMVYGKYPLFDSYEAALSACIDKILDLMIINKTERK